MKYNILFLLVLCFLQSSCIKEADFSGLIRSKYPVEKRVKQSLEWNETHSFKNIVVSKEDYTLLVSADEHIGSTKTIDNYLNLMERGKKKDITAMVFCGDLSSGRKKDIERFYSKLPDYSTKPWFVMVGNHELYFNGWETYRRLFGTSTYYFTIETPSKKDLYICLDSGGGTLGKTQLKWLKNILSSKRLQYDRCVIFTHSNFFRDHHTASTSPLIDELLVLMDMFEKYKVNMVITAHDHRRATHQLGNTHYIILDALRDDAKNATYMRLQKTKKGYDYQFVKP